MFKSLDGRVRVLNQETEFIYLRAYGDQGLSAIRERVYREGRQSSVLFYYRGCCASMRTSVVASSKHA
jgi:hypothetical protein